MKVYLEVYGCTANKSDACLIKGILKKNNYELVKKIDNSDIIILLTCTVINTTEQRMLSRLNFLKKTGKTIVVGGCMASIQTDLIKSIIPNAKILPAQNSYQILDVLEKEEYVFINNNKTRYPKFFENLSAPVLISEGCRFSCSYCITSIARGKLKSFSIDEIINNIKSAINQGCKEIQITAQDTSSYGYGKNQNLGNLLKNISKINGIFRVRVGMMNPYTCLKNINSIIKGFDNEKIFKFLHIPVQSGDNDILKKMNRKYTKNDFLFIIKKFRDRFPDISISTDIIVGFPTETNNQFLKTISLLKDIKPDITNITRFSARPYTKAKDMDGRLKTEIVKERSKILTEICSEISKENNLKHIGKKYNALITEKGKNNTYIGRSENYKPIVLKKNVEMGRIYPIKVTNAASTYLVGSIK